MPTIHPTAIIGREAQLADSVEIGPYCVLDGPVRLAEGVRLLATVHLCGPVSIGPRTVLWPGACVGFGPQDYKFKVGDRTAGVEIGADCLIREHATVHASTKADVPTRVGDRVFLMGTTHVGHDCQVGHGVIFVNGAGIAGHCRVGDGATLSGSAIAHQFVRIGRLAFLSGGSGVSMDVPPFCMVPDRNRLGGINLVGMRRAEIPRDDITLVRRAFREALRRPMPRAEMLGVLNALAAQSPFVGEIAAFVAENPKRSICPGKGKPPRDLTTWMQARRRGELPDLGDDDE